MLEISEQTNYEIGKYGHLHFDFIKKHRRGTYTTLLIEGRLTEYLHTIDEKSEVLAEIFLPEIIEFYKAENNKKMFEEWKKK